MESIFKRVIIVVIMKFKLNKREEKTVGDCLEWKEEMWIFIPALV